MQIIRQQSTRAAIKESAGVAAARLAVLLTLLLFVGNLAADWSGIAVQFSNFDSAWRFTDGNREAQLNSLSLQVEEKTASELRVGGSIGTMDLRLLADTAAASEKFGGEFVSVYLRQALHFSETISLHSMLSYRYTSGSESIDNVAAEIDWNETRLEIGASLRLAGVRVTPYASYIDLDGDISDDQETRTFTIDQDLSRGIRFDFYVDPTAFVRVDLLSGARNGGYLEFVRRY